ncbi:DUF2125 domain-containing protein [Celeribacter indicus]|uniref:DUF2125 domain-containing protein n=1 Tax=Celeribacter indicus TaxID=1208324 RepID=A0A0B5DY52_9RHOB|nr:DUF2125 domain-containing protein [Celeribacter indicus]AJE48373.1 hypothetical protein P73_3658 [Celeribacter indicus]SDW74201.1 hypothetical protein SAMN05443573_106207 [Celeribacter indicus]
MRRFLWLIPIAAILYAGYWVIGARGTEKAIESWIAARAAEGWQAEYSDVKTRGFPTRFDTVIREPQLADPRSGVAFSTPRIEILSQSTRPTRFTARAADEARFATPYQRIDVTQTRAEAELFVAAGPSLTLDHSSATLEDLAVTSSLGWGVTLDTGRFVTQRDAADPLTHRITLTAHGLEPAEGMMDSLDPEGRLTDRFDTFELDMRTRFDAPWDIHALEGPRPQPTHVDLTGLAAQWGPLKLRLTGAFDVDPRGYPEGTVAVKAENWREMIEIATAMGAIPEQMEKIALRAGGMLAGMSGRKDTIDAELTLRDGMITLGFIPIGPAPRLTIR